MRIPLSVRQRWDAEKDEYERLKVSVDGMISAIKKPAWHYTSRVKGLQSFAVKLESGRYRDGTIDDFFAATIVVPTLSDIEEAVLQVKTFTAIDSRRPEVGKTHKGPDEFPFDDVRLYVRLADSAGRPTGLEGLLFEIQVKTFLQHAWAIATHDLVYKGGRVDWSLARVAYQVKALLEHAEASIHSARELSRSPALAMEDVESTELRTILEVLDSHWTADHLPQDRVSVARNVRQAMQALDVPVGDLDALVRTETEKGRGAALLHVSPYNALIAGLAFRDGTTLRKSKFRFFVPREVEEIIGVLPSGWAGRLARPSKA